MIKVGRRGSLNAVLTVTGEQEHGAYPHLADTPFLASCVCWLPSTRRRWTRAPLTSSHRQWRSPVDVGNPAANVIPARAKAMLNVRFNDLHMQKALPA